jgi:poly(3-hydroxybutyrate) depolymerase
MGKFAGTRTFLPLLACLAILHSPLFAAEALPRLGADLSRTSVAGLSSGAYMAGQFEIAHSRDVIGAGIVAGGPYGCAESGALESLPSLAYLLNTAQATLGCTWNLLGFLDVLDPDRLARQANRLADSGAIDPLSGLEDDRLYLSWGRDDDVISEKVVGAAAKFYASLGLPKANIRFEDGRPGGHAFLTGDAGLACILNASPFINNCHYDQAGAILSFIYGALKPAGQTEQGGLASFDQTPFAGDETASLDDTGFVYIPRDCREKPGCAVLIVFHGCAQGRSFVGEAVPRQTGFARWASGNRIIVLYPQVKASSANPQGCWDWWGFTGFGYLTRDARQIKAVYAMLKQLASPPGG